MPRRKALTKAAGRHPTPTPDVARKARLQNAAAAREARSRNALYRRLAKDLDTEAQDLQRLSGVIRRRLLA